MIKEIIIGERKRQGMTQAALAETVGVRQATISDFEGGKTSLNSETLEKIIRILKIEVIPGSTLEMRIASEEEVEAKVNRIFSEPGIHQDYKGKEKDEWFAYWRKLLGAVEYKCPKCGTWAGYIRKTASGEVVGCDHCLRDKIIGYYNG